MLIQVIALLSILPVVPARADQGNCLKTTSSAYEEALADFFKAVQDSCNVDCAAYKKTYCATIKPGTSTSPSDDQIRLRLKEYILQQDALVGNLVKPSDIDQSITTHSDDIAAKARKRAGSVLLSQANDLEELILKPILLVRQMNFINRFTHLKEELEAAQKADPKNAKAAFKDVPGIVQAKTPIMTSVQDQILAIREGMECLETQGKALMGSK